VVIVSSGEGEFESKGGGGVALTLRAAVLIIRRRWERAAAQQ
jgi:hypothetical protein